MRPVRNTPSNVPAPPIETTGAARSAIARKVQEVTADQGSHRAGDVRDRRRPSKREDHAHESRGERGNEHRHRDTDPGTICARLWTIAATMATPSSMRPRTLERRNR